MTLRKTLHINCSGLLGGRAYTGRQELVSAVYLKDGLERTIFQWHWGSPCAFIGSPSRQIIWWEKALWVQWVVLKRWSWKGHSSVIMRRPLHVSLGLWGDRASAKRNNSTCWLLGLLGDRAHHMYFSAFILNMYTYIFIYFRISVHVLTHAYIHTYVCTYMETHACLI